MKQIELQKPLGRIGGFIAMIFIGFSLIIGGLVMIILGGVIPGATGNTGMVALSVVGIILIVGPGLALMSVGIPCWIVKGVKIKKYNSKSK